MERWVKRGLIIPHRKKSESYGMLHRVQGLEGFLGTT
jgi:hypothetical protein